MKWEFCKYCIINGKCENQDRGHKCETGYKILFEEKEKAQIKNCAYEIIKTQLKERLKEAENKNQKLKEQLKECLEVLKLVAGETIDFPHTVDECIEKINLVLGEDKC